MSIKSTSSYYKMKTLLPTLILCLLVLITNEAKSQFYAGASIGNSFINKNLTDLNGDDFKIDENSFGYKIFGGFGSKFIGGEGGYRDLGKVENEVNSISVQSKITGWDIAARGRLALGPVIAFAKAGAFFAKAKNEVGARSYEENSTNFLWGLGAGLKLGLIGLRIEYELLDIGSDSNLAQLTFGGTIHFGGK